MIRIVRPAAIPEPLQTRGAIASQALCERAAKGEELTFDQKIYGDPRVKDALVRMQHGKCAFCERRINEDGDVEHFRPKTASQQAAGHTLNRPGYYWLAYEWTNLVLACSACNQREKRNLFPLENPESRASSHHDDVSQESPLFLDPTQEDPEEFIGWRAEMPFPKDGNQRAEVTIEALGLQRPSLANLRLRKLAVVKNRMNQIQQCESRPHIPRLLKIAQELREELAERLSDEGEFAAMLRANIALPPMPENFSMETESL